MDLLWGESSGERVGHRLSVLLSTVRGVLDPARVAPPDHFLVATAANIAVNLDTVTVDVELFLDDARHGMRLLAAGRGGEAEAVLSTVEQTYRGEFCADDPYDEWSGPLRDEVRSTYLHVVRVLAERARRRGAPDDAVRHLLGLLATDAYDEQAHRDLVAVLTEAGRHGEAARAADRYAWAMREIGVAPAG